MLFKSYSLLTGRKHNDDWYEWCVFVDGGQDTIDRINSVKYILHPSFQDPVRTVGDREHRFALLSSGWGGFTVGIRVFFMDGSIKPDTYSLRLLPDNWPRKRAPEMFEDKQTELVYRALIHDKYRWRKVTTLAKLANLPNERVSQILFGLEKEELARKAPFVSIDGKELWGATAVVGVLPHR